MVAWQKKIGGCFGDQDQFFAGHPMDEKRAFELLTQLRDEGVGWREVEAEFRSHLSSTGQQHIDDQIKKVRKAYKFWLLD